MEFAQASTPELLADAGRSQPVPEMPPSPDGGTPGAKPRSAGGRRMELLARRRAYRSVSVLTLSGGADRATRSLLETHLSAMTSVRDEKFIVDVTALRYCDLGCAEMIMAAARTTHVCLVGATGPVRRVFEFLDPLKTVPRFPAMGAALLHS